MLECRGIAIGAIKGLVALTALEMDWTGDDTMKTTVNDISNITFIKRRLACRTELLKNGDGRTDGRVFSSPRSRSRTDRTRRLLWPYMIVCACMKRCRRGLSEVVESGVIVFSSDNSRERNSAADKLTYCAFLDKSTNFGTEVKVKGKVFPYSLPSVGPGADPGVQAVSPQVT